MMECQITIVAGTARRTGICRLATTLLGHPADHERHLAEMAALIGGTGRPDRSAIAAPRARYDIEQLTHDDPGPPQPPTS